MYTPLLPRSPHRVYIFPLLWVRWALQATEEVLGAKGVNVVLTESILWLTGKRFKVEQISCRWAVNKTPEA